MAQAQGYSKSQVMEAERLVKIADRWAEGYDRKTGVRFNVFASRTTPGVFYRTRVDGVPGKCTCPRARQSRSGKCVHVLACRIVTERVREEAARPQARYEDIYGNVDAF